MLTLDMAIVLAVIAFAAVLFVTEWLAVDLVAMLVLLTLTVTGVVSSSQAFAGFSNPAVIAIAAVLVLGTGLERAGVASLLGRHVTSLANGSEMRLLVATMLVSALLSGFMNNIGVAALLMPALLQVTRGLSIAPSRLLMPMAFGTLLGGLITLFGTSTNLLISGALVDANLGEISVFDLTPIGVTAALLGTLYMAVVGRRMLPTRDIAREGRVAERRLETAYALDKRLCALSIPDGSALDGRTLADSRLGSALGLNVVAITRGGRTELAPGAGAELRAGDRLLVEGRLDRLNQMRNWRHLVLDGKPWTRERLESITVDLAEVAVPADSRLVGTTLLRAGFRRRFGVNVLAIARGGELLHAALATTELRADDRLLLQGPGARLRQLAEEPDLGSYRDIDTRAATERFGAHARLMAVRLPEGSPLAGNMLAESRLGNAFDLTVLGMLHEGDDHLTPDPGEELRAGDLLLVQGRPDDLLAMQGLQELQVEEGGAGDATTPMETEEVGLMEVMLEPTSRLVDHTPREMRFRERYGLSVVAVWSEGRAYRTDLRDRRIGMGDVLLVHGPRERLGLLREDRDFLPLTVDAAERRVRPQLAPVGMAIMATVVLTVVAGWLPIHVAAPCGAAAMVLAGCLSMRDVYRAVEWRAVVLIAGMITLGAAMQGTGTADLLADTLLGSVAGLGPLAVVAVLFWLTALTAQFMPTAAVAVLISPIAIDAALAQGLEPKSLLIVVAIAASSAFLSPLGHPVNLMVMGLGGYRFSDYARVGSGLLVINFLLAMLLAPLLFPLRPAP